MQIEQITVWVVSACYGNVLVHSWGGESSGTGDGGGGGDEDKTGMNYWVRILLLDISTAVWW